MQNNSTVLYAQQHGVVTLTLNHPAKHNAFNSDTVRLLQDYLTKAEQNDAVRVIVLAANGEHFCAGADLVWMQNMANASLAENQQDALALAQLFHRLAHSSKATLALVHGAVMGGGGGLAACADLVIASEDTRFCFSEAKLGLIPATIAPYVIRRIGFQAARRYFLTAEVLDATSAHHLGLVDEKVSRAQLPERANALIQLIERNGPNAIREIKALLQRLTPISTPLIEETAQTLAAVRCSPEAQAGIRAFLNKSTPPWIKES